MHQGWTELPNQTWSIKGRHFLYVFVPSENKLRRYKDGKAMYEEIGIRGNPLTWSPTKMGTKFGMAKYQHRLKKRRI